MRKSSEGETGAGRVEMLLYIWGLEDRGDHDANEVTGMKLVMV